MNPQDFQRYGPIRRRRDNRTSQNMATPLRAGGYTDETLPIRTAARESSERGGSGWLLVPFVAMIVVLATVLGGLTYLNQTYEGRIYPGVSVQGVDLGEMTPEDAEQTLEARFSRFLRVPLRFEYQGQRWEPRPEEIGLQLSIRDQVAEAMRAGRGNGLVRDVQQVATIWQQGLDLPLRITLDARQLQAYLRLKAGELEQPATEASIIVDPETGTAQAKESAEGRMLLLDETIAQAAEGLQTLQPQVIPIRTYALKPMLDTKDIAEAKRTIDAMLQAPMELHFKEHTFVISQTEIAEMIAVTRVERPEGPLLNAQLDQQKLTRWVTRLADEIGRESIEPRVNWNGGNLQIFREGRSAYRLDIEQTVERFNSAVLDPDRKFELPVDEEQPRATPENLATLGIKELIATGKSDFTGSAEYRIHNIKAGVNLMHGILLAPGEEFSFNENVGAIDEEHGFVEGYAIVGNRTQKEPGGGICQVSTTLFRAAFYAGLPFTAWTPHRFRISWYEKYDTIGMDSTIFTGGGPDLRFENDTANWLLLEGIVDETNATVTFNIYGTKVPGRTVERTEPEITNETPPPARAVYVDDPGQPPGAFTQTDVARGGMDIVIYRTVKQDGVELRRTPFRTSFEPWPNIFVKNPRTPIPPGGVSGNE